ncbi:hypothetical protein NONI108955_34350 [Nocardia ninae]|uniref:Uncharacterized protein n=1 Tax=Nocardia ninae NBRC 108245 TaxID=1210091 RepID=A0A511MT18_9NOCA|nr:hypothetical protein [Nocardia ninae]GEM43337.1 hypothetical protein NN4_78560 [Nocardia ninae NBRC 108245]
MNSNDIRPIALGLAVGVSVFAALICWVEYQPWDTVAGHLARRQLTPAERAELDRLTAEKQARDKRYSALAAEDKQKQAERDAEIAAGFNPDLLLGDPVTSPGELNLTALVAEIEHAEQSYRHADCHLVYPHREALHLEFKRRNHWQARSTASRADLLRLDIAADRINTARNRPFVTDEPPSPVAAYGSFPYPDFAGPDQVDIDVDPETGRW